MPQPLQLPPPIRPIPALLIFTADHLLNAAFFQDLTPAACFNWWGCSVVVLNLRQMGLTQGPHTQTRSNGAGPAGRAGSCLDAGGWEPVPNPGCFPGLPKAQGGKRQRCHAGRKGKHRPSSSPISIFLVARCFSQKSSGEFARPGSIAPMGCLSPKKSPFLLEGGGGKSPAERWLERSLPLAGSTRSGDGARQRLSNEAI